MFYMFIYKTNWTIKEEIIRKIQNVKYSQDNQPNFSKSMVCISDCVDGKGGSSWLKENSRNENTCVDFVMMPSLIHQP